VTGNWLAAVGGVLTGIVIATVQRKYPDISFAALLGVGIACGVLFNVAMYIAVKKAKKR
jgi:hypothetical protein